VQDLIDQSVEEVLETASTTVLRVLQTVRPFAQASVLTQLDEAEEVVEDSEIQDVEEVDIFEDIEFENNYFCRNTSVVRTCDNIEGDNTSCLVNDVKVDKHEITTYAGGWEQTTVAEGEDTTKKNILKRASDFFGFGPDVKEIPERFETRSHTEDQFDIQPGETKYFKMEIEFPPLSGGEFWIEAVGDKEYGLLDPFWSSQWTYRMPITIDNTAGTSDLTDYQVFMELDNTSTYTDFWANVNADGSDVRFVQETAVGNEEGWYGTGWETRTPLVVQSSQVDSDQTDFPLYVNLADFDTAFFSAVQSDGDDIRITTSDGVTELAYELVSINTGSNTGEIHFKADTISSSVDTTFYIYHDNPNVAGYTETDTYGAENVWTNGYLAIYHLEEDAAGNGNTGVYTDSTSNSADGDDEIAATGKIGKVGRGQQFEGRNSVPDDRISLPNTLLDSETDLTISYWFESAITTNQALVSGGAGNEILLWQTDGSMQLYAVGTGPIFTYPDTDDGDFHLMTVLRNDTANEWEVFVDGQSVGAAQADALGALSIPAGCLLIGQEQDSPCPTNTAASQAFEGFMDELVFSNVLRSDDWISANYRNQATTSDFYATSSVETLMTTSFVELDHWTQHFDGVGEEADIWVQVDSLPAGASTTIHMYYGNAGASSASDEEATFTYDVLTDLYYVVEANSTGNIEVYSLIDNNEVSLDGGTSIALNEGETTFFTGYSSISVISALGPISATIDDVGADTIVPISFATTTHVLGSNRNTSEFHIYAPFASTTVSTYLGGSVTADQTLSMATGTAVLSTTDPSGSDGVVIEASAPVLVMHIEAGNRDSVALYPPTTRDIYGIDTGTARISTVTDDPDPAIYCSDGSTTATVTAVTRGETQALSNCTGVGDGAGDAIRLSDASFPITAIQQGDGDGGETSVFLPQHEFSTQYFLPTDTAYVAIACAPRFGASTIEVQTNGGTTVESATCTPVGNFPGKVYFNNGQDGDILAFTAGHQVVSTNNVPFYVIYEDDEEDNDETNIIGTPQARKYAGVDTGYSFGVQEFNIDAEYEQLSYAWYVNLDDSTPTSTWSLGDDGLVAEAEDITGQGAVDSGEVIRLRMNLLANTATGSASSSAFKLEYAESLTCSTADNWSSLGSVGSTTAAFSGYNNASVDDGSVLVSSLLASTTVLSTYEESNLSEFISSEIPLGDVAEWDWVLTNSNANTNANYCFRMVRSSGDTLATYTLYPQLETSGPPEVSSLIKPFDNEHTPSIRPDFQFVASDLSGDFLYYQIQVDDDVNFGSTILDQNSEDNNLQFTNTVVPSEKSLFRSGQTIEYTPPSDLVSSSTYWWRVRAIDPEGSNTYSDWSTAWSFTVDESTSVSEWFQTTDEQFDTGSLISATSSGSDSVTLDIGGAAEIGEYGSVAVTNGATTSVALFNTYTNPVITASVEYDRSVPDGDQVAARIFNKTGTGFDVLTDNFTSNAPGGATVHYVVMEAGEYLIDDGDTGLRVFATSTSVSTYIGSNISGDPGTDIVFPTAFSGSPAVLTMVTTINDPDWVVSNVYDGNDIGNAPTSVQLGVYLSDHIASDGHLAAEDVDIIVLDQGFGSNNGTLFDIFNTGIDAAFVDDTPDSFAFNQTFGGSPLVRSVGQLTMNGAQGSYAMVDTGTAVTATNISIAVDEGGTAGARTHADEDVSIVVFENATGTIIRAGNGQVTSSAIDFDDAEVGNSWGEVAFSDSGDITYSIEYQTGSGFADIPDSVLSGNSAGFTSSPINILSLDTDIYNEIRLVADFAGASPELYNWTVTWGQRVEIPELGDPFDNEKVATTTPTFDFITTDPQGDGLVYQISWSTDDTFDTGSTTHTSDVSLGFANQASSTDVSPFVSGDTIAYTIQSGDTLTDTQTYWWRVRATDPAGGNAYSPWSEPDSFTVDTNTLVSTWMQTTEEQFEEGTLDGVTASTSNSIIITTDVGEYGTTTVTNNDWTTITTELTYNNMVVVASPEYAFNSADNGRTVQVKEKTSNSFMIKAENYTLSLSGSTDVDYIVMEAGDWLLVDGGAGMRMVAGTAADVSTVKGSVPAYVGGSQIVFNPSFAATPAGLSTVSSANGSKWVATVMDDGSAAGEITTANMYLSLGIGLDTDTTRVAEDIDYLAFAVATGTNNGVLYDSFNTGDVVTEDETESTVNFFQAFSGAPGLIVAQNNATHGTDGGFAQQDTDGVTDATTLSISVAEIGASAGNHASEIVSVLAFESESGTVRRESANTGGLTGTVASEPILFSDGSGPKFEQALFATTSPGTSSTTVQVQYLTSTSSWALIPDSQISGNNTGSAVSPIDLTAVDIVEYPTIRLYATLRCDDSNCPELENWSIEWAEGVPIEGTIKEYDRTTVVTSGTLAVAVNGTTGNTGTVAVDGTWSIPNVTAFEGDTVTVWVQAGGVAARRAVGAFVYDGVGDINGIELFEQHLSISSNENGTTTNANLDAYDHEQSGFNDDLFFDVDGNNDLSVCATTGCDQVNLYIGSGDIYIPDDTSSGNIAIHDLVNDGTVALDGNIVRVSGSWDNNATLSVDTSSVIFTATSTTETVADIVGLLRFNDLTFGETTGSATWQAEDPYDIEGGLTVDYGTFDRASSSIAVAGNVTTGANGFWSGVATTTFDGAGTNFWLDTNATLQNIGNVAVDGSVKTLITSSDTRAQSLAIEAGNSFNAGGANTLYLSGNLTNGNVFTAQTGTVVIDGPAVDSVIYIGASSLYSLTASTTDGGSVAFSQTSVVMLGDFAIATGTVTMPSVSASIGGSFTNTGGIFAHNNAEVVFTSSAVETILVNGDTFNNSFYDLSFTGNGDWVFTDVNATTTNHVDISAGTVTLPSGQFTVGRNYIVGGSGAFEHNDGEVLFLVRANDSITSNGSDFNDVRVQEGSPLRGGAFNASWLYRDVITISSGQIDDDLTDFPVYVDLSNLTPGFFSSINADAGDVRITTSDGVTEVAREIVAVSVGMNTGELHFNAPTISSSTDSIFYLYYGNGGASDYAVDDTYGAENVWDSNYVGVYHLSETSSGSSGEFVDSTSFGNDGTGENTLPVPTTGRMGGGQDFPGGGHIDLGTGFTDLGTNNEYTLDAWLNLDANGDSAIVSQWPGGSATGFLWWADNSATDGYCHYVTGTYTPNDCQTSTGQILGTWQYVNAIYDGSDGYAYVDGLPTGAGGTAATFNQDTNPFSIGSNHGNDNSRTMNGQMDEVRISSIARSDAWITASYRNQATTTDFYTAVSGVGTSTRIFSGGTVAAEGDVIIESGQAQFPSSNFNIGGSFDNDGTFFAGSGAVNFISTTSAETVAAGMSPFYTLTFNDAGGNWTVTENATATNAIVLTDADSFTVNSSITLESTGTFFNAIGGASTTWTGSTLRLTSGTEYEINTKTTPIEQYENLSIGNNTDISSWNSAATSTVVAVDGSLYSQDNAGVDGNLFIFGDYHISTTTEYWSYATDFDGEALGSSRKVFVSVSDGSVVSLDGGTLHIIGEE
jgi:hypothetical protein